MAPCAKRRALLTIPFVGFGHLANRSDAHLRREAKAFTDVVIDQLVQLDLIGAAQRKRRTCDVVAGGVEGFKRMQERRMLLRFRSQFDEKGLFHATKGIDIDCSCQ
jgi:hypothetical protein